MQRTAWTFNVAVDFWRSKKAIMAGRDGRDLFLCSIAWSTEEETDGQVPSEALDALAAWAGISPAAAKKAANKLLDVGLWEATGEGWAIHDYTQWQLTAAEREKQRAQNAERQGRHRQRNALRHDRSNGESHAPNNPVINGVYSRQSFLEVIEMFSSSVLGGAGGDDDERKITTASSAIRLLADCDLAKRLAAEKTNDQLTPVGDRKRWLDGACVRRWSEHGEQAYELARSHPDWTPAQVAEHLDAADEPERPVGERFECPDCGWQGAGTRCLVCERSEP